MQCAFDELEALDQYMLRQTVAMAGDVTRWYDEFAFHKIYHRVNDFCVVELSAFYFDVLKDRLVYLRSKFTRRAAPHRPRSGASAKPWCACWPLSPASPARKFGRYLPQPCRSSLDRASRQFSRKQQKFGHCECSRDDPKQLEDWATLLVPCASGI